MRKEGIGEERDTTTYLIKIQIFTHASCVTTLYVQIAIRDSRASVSPSVGSSPSKLPRSPAEMKWKASVQAQQVQILGCEAGQVMA